MCHAHADGAHEGCPDKEPAARLEALEVRVQAGAARMQGCILIVQY